MIGMTLNCPARDERGDVDDEKDQCEHIHDCPLSRCSRTIAQDEENFIMARMIYNMLQSVDGYIAGPEGGPQMPMFGGAP